MSKPTAWAGGSRVNELENGDLEIAGHIVKNPFKDVVFVDPNTPEFKALIWSRIYREGLHIKPYNTARIRAVLLNAMEISVGSIIGALEVDSD